MIDDFLEVGVEKYNSTTDEYERVGVMTIRRNRVIQIIRIPHYKRKPVEYYYEVYLEVTAYKKTKIIVNQFNYDLIVGQENLDFVLD